jgi:hypothetical protein
MSLPGPVLDVPATLWFVEDGRLRRHARLLDAAGQTLAQFAATLRGDRETELVGAKLLLRHRGVFRVKLDAIDPAGTSLVHVAGEQLSADGETFELRETVGGDPRPWVLALAGEQIAVITPQRAGSPGTSVQVTGAKPIALLVLIVCCEWGRVKAVLRSLG